MSVKFRTSREDGLLIQSIAERASALAEKVADTYPLMDATMDVTACHANGNPLRLAELLAADDANFGHDIFGIRRHLDRTTGQLGGCFVPRFSHRKPA